MINIVKQIEDTFFQMLWDNSPDPIENKIRSFRELSDGWHFGEGGPPSEDIIKQALEVCQIGKRYSLKCEVFPTVDKGVTVAFYDGDQCIEVTVTGENKLIVSHEQGIGFDYEEVYYKDNASEIDIKKQCQKIAPQTGLSLSESYIHDYLIRTEEDSSQAALSHHQVIGEFQPLISDASNNTITPQFAST